MPRAKDSETGQFTTVYGDDEILGILADAGPTGTGTREVADTLGCSLVHASRRLSDLADDDWVTGRKIGGASVWTLSDTENGTDTADKSGSVAYIPRKSEQEERGDE